MSLFSFMPNPFHKVRSEETRSFVLYTSVKKMSHIYTLANACTARSDKHTAVHIHDHHLAVPQKLALLSSLG